MKGINSFLFQPISIQMPYLQSVISDVILGYKTGSLESNEMIDAMFINDLENQASQARKSGANTYPIIVPVKGPILKHSNFNYVGTQTLSRVIKSIDSNSEVSHIILDIDSGGGMVSGTTEFSEAIRACNKPTIAFTNGYACSAAQQIFSAADIGVSSPYADLLGSIGTLISYQDFSMMFEKWGAKLYEAYAPQSTQKNKSFRDWKLGDAKAIEQELEVHASEFISIMKKYRGDKIKDDGAIFKGKTYKPEEAKEVGLVDEIMTMEELLKKI